MNRSSIITVLLVIAAAVLAIALFAAGSMWRGRIAPGGSPSGEGAALSLSNEGAGYELS